MQNTMLIVYENPQSKFTFEKTMFGAYILFPYDNEEEYKQHRFYKSIDTVNIGGIPFLPGAMNITVRQSRQSGVARATCPD